MSLPIPDDPVIHGIPKEKLPFTEIKINNADPKRMETSIPSEQLYKFDHNQEVPGI